MTALTRCRTARTGEIVTLERISPSGFYRITVRHDGRLIKLHCDSGRDAHAAYRLSPARISELAGN